MVGTVVMNQIYTYYKHIVLVLRWEMAAWQEGNLFCDVKDKEFWRSGNIVSA